MSRGKHKSVPKELKKNITWLENNGAKVILGLCSCVRHKYAPGTIRLMSKTDAGFRATGYSGNGVMKFFIRCKDDEVISLIEERFGSN